VLGIHRTLATATIRRKRGIIGAETRLNS